MRDVRYRVRGDVRDWPTGYLVEDLNLSGPFRGAVMPWGDAPPATVATTRAQQEIATADITTELNRQGYAPATAVVAWAYSKQAAIITGIAQALKMLHLEGVKAIQAASWNTVVSTALNNARQMYMIKQSGAGARNL